MNGSGGWWQRRMRGFWVLASGTTGFFQDRHDRLISARLLINPKVVIEVLSPITRNHDLGDKARTYSRIPSLAELLLIEQREVRIEHWRRQPNEHWDIEVVQDRAATVSIESIGCDVLVSEIYSGAEFA
jgi:Uma2 family endonuclease